MNEQAEFETADLYLTAALSILLDAQPTYRVEKGRTIFVFPISDALYRAVSQYNGGIPIDALQYSQAIKRLRAEMIIRRGGVRQHDAK